MDRQVTAFQTGPKAVTLDFNPGDIGYVKRNNGHYVKNVGDTELQYLEVFRSSYYADVSLSDWLTHSPPEMVAETLNIDEATIAKFPNDRPLVMPRACRILIESALGFPRGCESDSSCRPNGGRQRWRSPIRWICASAR